MLPPAGRKAAGPRALAERRLCREGCLRMTGGGHRPAAGIARVRPRDVVAIERNGCLGVMDTGSRRASEGAVRPGGGTVDALHGGEVHRDHAACCGGAYFGRYLSS